MSYCRKNIKTCLPNILINIQSCQVLGFLATTVFAQKRSHYLILHFLRLNIFFSIYKYWLEKNLKIGSYVYLQTKLILPNRWHYKHLYLIDIVLLHPSFCVIFTKHICVTSYFLHWRNQGFGGSKASGYHYFKEIIFT